MAGDRMPEPATTFVLGAGFSVEQQYPLVRGLTERVVHFLEAERHARYQVFLDHDPSLGYAQFYEGLSHVNPNGALGFEEILVTLAKHLPDAHREDPCHVTNEVLRIGVARLLWCINCFTWRVASCYQHFARRLLAANGTWHVVTFNWDILVERAITEAVGKWRYALTGEPTTVAVIKPHGSINWSAHEQSPKWSAQYSDWEPIGPGSKLSFDGKQPLCNQDMEEINTDFRYCLYPGDPDLPSTNSDLQLLWDDVTSVITASDRVVFMGYSLPTYDTFAGQRFRALCAAKAVEVYDPSPETRLRFSEALPHASCADMRFSETPYALAPSE
jgi:hypothetical protein